jgi:protein-tyrosine phosphatase
VPDPYYGSAEWFDRVFDLIDAAAEGLLMELQRRGFQGPDI